MGEDCIIFALLHHDNLLQETLGEHDSYLAHGQLSLREVALLLVMAMNQQLIHLE